MLAFRRSRQPMKVYWGQVIGVELAIFLTLAVLSVLSGNRLTEGNMWGGQIGWGLSMLLTRVHWSNLGWGTGFLVLGIGIDGSLSPLASS